MEHDEEQTYRTKGIHDKCGEAVYSGDKQEYERRFRKYYNSMESEYMNDKGNHLGIAGFEKNEDGSYARNEEGRMKWKLFPIACDNCISLWKLN